MYGTRAATAPLDLDGGRASRANDGDGGAADGVDGYGVDAADGSSTAAPVIDDAPLIDDAVLDREAVASLLEVGGPELVAELASDFAEQARRASVTLREALARGDAAQVARTAHILKASSQSLGASRPAASFVELERIGRSGSLAGAAAIVERLGTEVAAALGALGHAAR